MADARMRLPADLMAGRTVFITGGGSGVNLGIARGFAQVGADIGICGRTAERLDAAAQELRAFGARVHTAVADVRDDAAVTAALEGSRDALGPVEVLVCGAAGNFIAPAERLSSNGFRAVVDIDLLGTFHAARAAFGQLAETRGNVLLVSGGQSYLAFTGQAHVSAAKAGVDQLMRALALEWAPHGIRVNSIVPGPVAGTEGMRRLAEGGRLEVWEQSVPLGRCADPAEIAAVAVTLCSELGSYVTGAQVVVDGGLSLSGPALVNAAGLGTVLDDPAA